MQSDLKRLSFYFIHFSFLLLTACSSDKPAETRIAFSMSDSMYNRCSFSVAQLQTVKNEVRLFGKVVADNSKTAQVFPIMSGAVKSINVEIGDYVRQGQILASIQSSEVASYQKQRLDAISDLAIAEKNLLVARELYEGKLNSEKDIVAAEKELDKAKAELRRINEIYNIYQLKAGSLYHITAPTSGFIVTKKINRNEQLRSDESEPVFSIAEINEVWVLANVNETDIARIETGQDVEISTLAFPGKIYTGKIDKIFNAIDPETKSMKVRIRVPNADLKLKPEMNCTVSVKYAENEKMITVPSSALIFDKSKYWMIVFKDKKDIETRKVEIYRQLKDSTYIKSGISEGEMVISQNGLLIYDAIND